MSFVGATRRPPRHGSHNRSRIGIVLVASALIAALTATPARSSGEVAGRNEPALPTAQALEPPEPVELVPPVDVSVRRAADVAPERLAAVETEEQQASVDTPWRLAFGGDVHFEGLLNQRLADDPGGMLDPVAEMLADADLAMVNLETAVTGRGQAVAKGFTFRTRPEALTALRGAGVDVVSIANNHGMDYGLEGLIDTVAAAEAEGMPMVGGGLTAEQAYAPFATEIGETTFAVIGATQVLDSALIESWTAGPDKPGLASAKDRPALVAAVREAASSHDVVVVYLHWGIEGDVCPAQRQMDLADELIGAGARVIVGGHAHRVQGGGFKENAVVHYGLGNFVFYTPSGPGTSSGVFEVTGTGSRVDGYRWIPARLEAGVATRVSESEAQTEAEQGWDQLRDCTDLSESALGPTGGPQVVR